MASGLLDYDEPHQKTCSTTAETQKKIAIGIALKW
jgi:hypothetical protein